MGVYLTNDNTNLHDLNITPQLTKIDNLISMQRFWYMTQYRHITIVKSFLISWLIYELTLPPTVEVTTKELQNKSDNFISGFKKHVVKKRLLNTSYKVGGLNMVDLEHFLIAYNSLGFTDCIKIFIGINCSIMTQLIYYLGNIICMFLIYPMLKFKY